MTDTNKSQVETLGIIVGISPQDNRFDVDEAYGAGTFDRIYPDCEFCGMKFAHPDDCPVAMKEAAKLLCEAVEKLEAAWTLDNQLREGSANEEACKARLEVANCLGVISSRARRLTISATSPRG